jgi:hypothetical protein
MASSEPAAERPDGGDFEGEVRCQAEELLREFGATAIARKLVRHDGAETMQVDVSRADRQSQVAVCVFQLILRRECSAPFDFVVCLRRSTDRVRVPAGFNQAREVLSAFAHAWTLLAREAQESCALGSTDAAEALAFSGVMLSHNLHGSGIGSRRVTRSRFVEGCRCLDTVCDVPDAMLGALYDDIAEQPLGASVPTELSVAKMEALDAQPVTKEGWLMVKELDSPLGEAVPWRRRWMRIYDHDAAMFLTPQQWGLDGEIILSLPLQGLVVSGMGSHDTCESISSRAQVDTRQAAARSEVDGALLHANSDQVAKSITKPITMWKPITERITKSEAGR